MRLFQTLCACVSLYAAAMPSCSAGEEPLIAPSCEPKPQGPSVGDRASCPFRTDMDIDPARIPAELPTVKCNCVDALCSTTGDYRCQEVRSTFHVAYVGPDGYASLRNGTVELPTSCVCVASRTVSASSGLSRTKDNPGDLAKY